MGPVLRVLDKFRASLFCLIIGIADSEIAVVYKNC